MFQCVGLGSVESGGCGEDWYHPECLMGLPKDWYLKNSDADKENAAPAVGETEEKEHPTPPGFPNEDDFEALICYKCVEANPWIKAYAGTEGFLPPVFHKPTSSTQPAEPQTATTEAERPTLKRKASDDPDDAAPRASSPTKRLKEEGEAPNATTTQQLPSQPISTPPPAHKHTKLPPAPSGRFSILLQPNFREQLCHCPACFPNLIPHKVLLDEESTYEPSLSDSSNPDPNDPTGHSTRSAGSRSLLDRGEAALNNVDRVRAIEGVMVYNHLRDKVKDFLRPFAESGQAVGADDIKKYFEGLRGDSEAIREAGRKGGAAGEDTNGDGEGGDQRREQSGY